MGKTSRVIGALFFSFLHSDLFFWTFYKILRSKGEAGDEWLFHGPATYYPRVEVIEVEKVFAQILDPLEALHVKARKNCKDYKKQDRKAGEGF